jgi:hypothetical protein
VLPSARERAGCARGVCGDAACIRRAQRACGRDAAAAQGCARALWPHSGFAARAWGPRASPRAMPRWSPRIPVSEPPVADQDRLGRRLRALAAARLAGGRGTPRRGMHGLHAYARLQARCATSCTCMGCMRVQEKLALQDEQIDAVAALVRARTAAPPPPPPGEDGAAEGALRLPSDVRCDPMRSRLAQYVAHRSCEGVAAGALESQAAVSHARAPPLREDTLASSTLLLPAALEQSSAAAAELVRLAFPGLGAAAALAATGDAARANLDAPAVSLKEDAVDADADADVLKEERISQPAMA